MEISYHEKGRDEHYKLWHFTDANTVIYTYSEGGSIVFQDGVYPIERGTLCFIASGKLHYTMPSAPSLYERSKIYLPDAQKSALLSLVPASSDFFRLFSQNNVVFAHVPEAAREEIDALFAEAKDAREQNMPERFSSCFLRLMIAVKEYAAVMLPTPRGALSRALDYVNRRYKEDITLDDICAYIHTSKYYFCRIFKEAMGVTVMEYLLSTRLAAARSMLAESSLTVSRIAEECGFSCLSYFCQVFKEKTGLTAKKYRLATQKSAEKGNREK